jgi:hypothetical protein
MYPSILLSRSSRARGLSLTINTCLKENRDLRNFTRLFDYKQKKIPSLVKIFNTHKTNSLDRNGLKKEVAVGQTNPQQLG